MKRDPSINVNDAILLSAVAEMGTATGALDPSGMDVYRFVNENVGSMARATVYLGLYDLYNAGYLRCKDSGPLKTRGGRRRQMYSLSPTGERQCKTIAVTFNY